MAAIPNRVPRPFDRAARRAGADASACQTSSSAGQSLTVGSGRAATLTIVLLEDGMEVGAAKSECTRLRPGAVGPCVGEARVELWVQSLERAFVQIELGIGVLDADRGRQDVVVKRQRRVDQARPDRRRIWCGRSST